MTAAGPADRCIACGHRDEHIDFFECDNCGMDPPGPDRVDLTGDEAIALGFAWCLFAVDRHPDPEPGDQAEAWTVIDRMTGRWFTTPLAKRDEAVASLRTIARLARDGRIRRWIATARYRTAWAACRNLHPDEQETAA